MRTEAPATALPPAPTTPSRPTSAASAGKIDTPAFPAVGEPAFGTLDGTTTELFNPDAGLIRALDIVAPDYQKGGQDFIAGWDASTGQFIPGFPAVDNDLSFITGEVVGDITGEAPKQEVVAGTASNDLEAYNSAGLPASTAWPKLTGGWTVATPVLGSLGTLDTSSEAKKDIVSITREGTLAVYSTPASACSPSSWPNFHHDIANSGDYTRDAVPPGVPYEGSAVEHTLTFDAPRWEPHVREGDPLRTRHLGAPDHTGKMVEGKAFERRPRTGRSGDQADGHPAEQGRQAVRRDTGCGRAGQRRPPREHPLLPQSAPQAVERRSGSFGRRAQLDAGEGVSVTSA